MTEEQQEGIPCVPPPEVAKALDRIGDILTILCEPLGGNGEEFNIMIANIDSDLTRFLVTVPWGQFVLYDNGHEDHWSGGTVVDAHTVQRVGGCMPLHAVLRLHLMIVIDTALMKLTEYLDHLPPPGERH